MKKETKLQEVEEVQEIIQKEKSIELIIEKLKKENREVFVTDIAGLTVVWRKLKRSEYKELMTKEFSENEELAFLEKQDFVASKVLLYPEDVEQTLEDYAGIADVIATETMIKTGFGLSRTKEA